MIARILSITCFVSIAGFFSPQWIGYAVLGLVIGFVIQQVRCSRTFRQGFAFLIAFCGIAVMLIMLFPPMQPAYQMAQPPRIVEVNYTASISPLPGITQWLIQEEFLIPKTELLTDWLDHHSGPDELPHAETSNAVSEKIIWQLQLDGWTSAGFIGPSEQLRRNRNVEAKLDWIRATTVFEIPVRIRYLRLYGRRISFVPDSNSEITITSPKYVVASTFPVYTSREDVLREDQERLTIPFGFSRLDQLEFRMAVLNPLLRWPLGPTIGSISLWSGLKWILLAVCAVFSDQIKEKLLKPIVAPLFRSKKENDSDEA